MLSIGRSGLNYRKAKKPVPVALLEQHNPMCCPQPIFDGFEYPEFNQDRPVLRHELGHAVTWFRFGEGIGRLKCCRDSDEQLRAGVSLWPRTGGLEKLISREYAQQYAERLLAGELAARRARRKRTDQICSKGLPVDSSIDCLAGTLQALNPESDLAKEDIVKVLKLAINHAQLNWRAWMAERLSCADAVVGRNWAAIERIAQRLEGKLPRAGKSYVWPGTDVIAEMRRDGVRSEKHPAIEIIFNGQSGGFLTRLRRFVREMGRNGIVCRYVDLPEEDV